MMGSSSGSGPRCLDPHRVYELVIRRRPRELLAYVYSIPGACADLHCQGIILIGRALRLSNMVSGPPSSPAENRKILVWAQLAQYHAIKSRFCAPEMATTPLPGNASDFTADTGHDMFPHSSSSYSGRMLIHEPDSIVHRHAAMHNPLTRIPSEMLPPLQNTAPERRRGPRPLHNSTGRPSRAVTSQPPRAVTSPSRTCVPPHRHRAQVEQATSPPPLSGQAQLSRRGWRSIPLHPHRHTIQGHKRFDWAKELRSWSDDGLD